MPASGKRHAWPSSLHGVAARPFLVLPLACLSAAAALLGVPLLAFVAGFAAVALVVDVIFPVTGFLRVDSQHAFQRLVWQRRREAFGKRRPWRHDHPCLELLPGQLERSANRRHLGIQPIALDSIVGTIEPERPCRLTTRFDRRDGRSGRWELMWMARRRGDSLPPISVYRIGERHYVIDGHHRVSVERSLDAENIDADVIETLPLSTDQGAPTAMAGSRSRQPDRVTHVQRRSPQWPSRMWRNVWRATWMAVVSGVVGRRSRADARVRRVRAGRWLRPDHRRLCGHRTRARYPGAHRSERSPPVRRSGS
jgi:hypothetical protein